MISPAGVPEASDLIPEAHALRFLRGVVRGPGEAQKLDGRTSPALSVQVVRRGRRVVSEVSQSRVQRMVRCDEPIASDPNRVGPKAANLARLRRARVPVPVFFVYVFGHDAWPPVSPELHSAFLDALTWLRQQGAAAFAVRSSADIEDRASGSLAGQLISEIGLTEPDEVEAAMTRCLSAGSTPRVRAYLREREVPAIPSIHLIIQAVVEATWAGVAFTGVGAEHRFCTLIEGRRGSADTVTSGRASPERLMVIQRPSAFPSVVSLIGNLPAQPLRGPDVPDWLRIAQLSHRAHKMLEFGADSADVEWVWDGVQYWVVQARPGQPPPLPAWVQETSRETWTSFFFAERFIRPVSRLGWDFLRPSVEHRAFREPLRYLGYKRLSGESLTKLVAGHPVTRLEVFRRLHELIPAALLPPEKALAFFPDGVPRWGRARYIRRLFVVATRVAGDPDGLPWANLRRWRSFVPRYVQRVQVLHRAISKHRAPEEWLADMEEGEKLSYELLGLHRWSLIFAEGCTGLLQHLVVWGIDCTCEEARQITFNLLAGLPENLTVQMNAALREGGKSGPEERQAKIEECLRQFGHRSASLDLSEPTWLEHPTFVERLAIRAAVEAHEGTPKSPQERHRLLTEMLDRSRSLPGMFRALWLGLFRWTMHYAEAFAVLRENQRHYWHMVLAEMRRAALKIGESLVAEKVLRCPEDLFDLSRSELQALIKGQGGPRDLTSLLDRRKAERHAWAQAALPSLMTDDEETSERPHERARREGCDVFRGLGVSPGVASGQAYFPLEYDPQSIPKGSILVMPGLDPGWTPILSLINGLVTEAGGMLSHGAILAREFNVPAVASVSGARRIIRPGDWLEVDGVHGSVRILRRAHSRDSEAT